MATYLADRVVVYEGLPSVKAMANTYVRPAISTLRPRINKADSMKDKEQKSSK
ncbi:6922_t:CDS:2 [Funneliformis caledonium]|uniref:6922_t:CDS:1 n=1 Tax=Funneliformis caledonium TaxID=1117310 RepID=A0A9N8ZX83_9GLOM|nr:6922_t:CDS:2 [Funneliformis caledonium]